MPSRENMYLLPSGNGALNGGVGVPEFKITSLQVDQLVSEIKENLRLTASNISMKSRPSISRKSSRASPYKIPTRCTSTSTSKCDQHKISACPECTRKGRCLKQGLQEETDDPYELLQKLLRDGGLIQEAVRRVQSNHAPKQRDFYDSEGEEETCSPDVEHEDSEDISFHDSVHESVKYD